MLKRHQVLLPEWLGEFIRYISKEYDISFSEVVRVGMSVYFATLISVENPKLKFDVTPADITNLKRSAKTRESQEIQHKLLSKIYFEARKTIEGRLSMEKDRKESAKIDER